MSAPDPQLPQRQPLLPSRLVIRLAIAFGVGLLLFLLVWLNSRRDYDFYKADGTEAAAGQSDTLPVPLPPDVAGSDGGDATASGLRTVARGSATEQSSTPGSDQPRIIEAPARPAPPPRGAGRSRARRSRPAAATVHARPALSAGSLAHGRRRHRADHRHRGR